MPALLAVSEWNINNLVFWSAIAIICVVPSISYYLYRWRKTEMEIELKRDMVARGMSADEIERVLGAGSPSRASESGSLKETQARRQS